MLFIFLSMLSKGTTKMELMGFETCRYFATVYLTLRLVLFVLFAVTCSGIYCPVAILALIAVAMLIARVQPYKAEIATYSALDSVFILALAMWYGTMVCLSIAAVIAHNLVETLIIVSFLVAAST